MLGHSGRAHLGRQFRGSDYPPADRSPPAGSRCDFWFVQSAIRWSMIATANAFQLCILFRTPVYMTGSYLLLLLYFTFRQLMAGHMQEAFLLAFAVTASLMVHEFGHVFAAKFNGHNSRVVFVGLGAVTIPDGESHGWRGILLSLAGPAAGFLLAFAMHVFFAPVGVPGLWDYAWGYPVMGDGTLWPYLHWLLVRIGVLWTVFNLLPIQPMDGGQALREFLTLFMRARKARFITSLVGAALAVGMAWWFLTQWNSLIGTLLLGFLAWQNFEAMKQNR